MQSDVLHLRFHRQCGQQFIMYKLDGIQQPQLIEAPLVFWSQVRPRRLERVRAGAGVDHDGQPSLLRPFPEFLDRGIPDHRQSRSTAAFAAIACAHRQPWFSDAVHGRQEFTNT